MQFRRSNAARRRCELPRLSRSAYAVALGCVIGCVAGCQYGLTPKSGLPSFGKSAKEVRVERQAEKDPFPTPGEVGLK